jgi:tellurite resistance protein TerC
VLVCIEITDLIFALDSIPAIFGITKDRFIIFTSNVFAILGLRSMYFLLAGVIDKFHYLKYGLAVVRGFVGVKMLTPLAGVVYARVTGEADPHWHIDKFVSLGVIVSALGISVLVSLLFPNKEQTHNPLENAEPAARLES